MIRNLIILFWFLFVISVFLNSNNLFFKLVEYSAIFAICVHFLEYLYFYKRISRNTNYMHGFLMTMLFGFEFVRKLRK